MLVNIPKFKGKKFQPEKLPFHLWGYPTKEYSTYLWSIFKKPEYSMNISDLSHGRIKSNGSVYVELVNLHNVQISKCTREFPIMVNILGYPISNKYLFDVTKLEDYDFVENSPDYNKNFKGDYYFTYCDDDDPESRTFHKSVDSVFNFLDKKLPQILHGELLRIINVPKNSKLVVSPYNTKPGDNSILSNAEVVKFLTDNHFSNSKIFE